MSVILLVDGLPLYFRLVRLVGGRSSWQEAVRAWLATEEARAAMQAASLPDNAETFELLVGCERWPVEIWRTDYSELRSKFTFDLYRATVVATTTAQ